MLIDGELVGSSSKETFESTSPGTLEHLTEIPDGTADDAEDSGRGGGAGPQRVGGLGCRPDGASISGRCGPGLPGTPRIWPGSRPWTVAPP